MFTGQGWGQGLLAVATLALLAACGGGGGGGSTTATLEPSSPNIVKSTVLAASTNCPNGGVHVDWGVDKNGSGVLDADEITGGGDICNGSSGNAGNNGAATLVVSQPFSGDFVHCPLSGNGIKLTIWLDLNGDSVPNDNNETFAYICGGPNGTDGFSVLVVTSIEPPGDNCPAGGLKIRSGQDTTRDGSLDDESNVATNYVCNLGSVALIQVPDWQTPWYLRNVTAVGFSTWNGVYWNGAAWQTLSSQPTQFYDSFVLTNRSGADESVDVAVQWGLSIPQGLPNSWLPGRMVPLAESVSAATPQAVEVINIICECSPPVGESVLYDFPFNPLLPLTNVMDASITYGNNTTTNWLSFALPAGASMVLVPSPLQAFDTRPYVLNLASSLVLDASAVDGGTPLLHTDTATQNGVQHYRLTGLGSNSTYQAIVTAADIGDDTGVDAHNGPFAPTCCGYSTSTLDAAGGRQVGSIELNSDSGGNAWLDVLGFNTSVSGNYELNVRPPPSVESSQLSIGVGHAGSVGLYGTTSTYSLDLTPFGSLPADTPFVLTLSNPYPTTDFALSLDDGTHLLICNADQVCVDQGLISTTCTGVTACAFRTLSGSVLNANVAMNGQHGGAEYFITLSPGTDGTIGAPMALTNGVAQNSSVDSTRSYYSMGVVGGLTAEVDLTGITFLGASAPSLSVTFSDDGDAPASKTCVLTAGGPCQITVFANATLLTVTVDGSATDPGATYTIQLTNNS